MVNYLIIHRLLLLLLLLLLLNLINITVVYSYPLIYSGNPSQIINRNLTNNITNCNYNITYNGRHINLQNSAFTDLRSSTRSFAAEGDDNIAIIPIGFQFCYYTYCNSNITIATNGYITFDSSRSIVTDIQPNSPTGSFPYSDDKLWPGLAYWFADLTVNYPTPNSVVPESIIYQTIIDSTINHPNNHILVLQFRGVYNNENDNLSIQIKLFEFDYHIEIIYIDVQPSNIQAVTVKIGTQTDLINLDNTIGYTAILNNQRPNSNWSHTAIVLQRELSFNPTFNRFYCTNVKESAAALFIGPVPTNSIYITSGALLWMLIVFPIVGFIILFTIIIALIKRSQRNKRSRQAASASISTVNNNQSRQSESTINYSVPIDHSQYQHQQQQQQQQPGYQDSHYNTTNTDSDPQVQYLSQYPEQQSNTNNHNSRTPELQSNPMLAMIREFNLGSPSEIQLSVPKNFQSNNALYQ